MAVLRRWDHVLHGGAGGDGIYRAGHGDPRVGLVLDDGACEQVPAHGCVQRRHDQSGNAAGRHGIDPDDLDSDCAPMAAMFFQGMLGSFMAYSQIGGSPVAQAPGPSGQPPGSYYTPAAPEKGRAGADDGVHDKHSAARMTLPQSDSTRVVDTGLRAAHPGKQ